jgi:2-dehydro-3-deoxygluconokinase
VEAPRRLEMAVRTGAYAVSVPGDCEGMPFREELTSFISINDVIR